MFVVEACQNCSQHGWNTRHNEAKYRNLYKALAQAILVKVPQSLVMRNQIPKHYLPYDLYNNLVPNKDNRIPCFEQVPRVGAFEVSYKGMLIFSKLKSGRWPNVEEIAE